MSDTAGSKTRHLRLTREGKYWLLTTAVLLAIGQLKNVNLLLLLGYFLLSVAALNALTAGRRLKTLQARRRLAEPVFAGHPCAVEVAVTNSRRRGPVGVRVEDRGPDHDLAWFAAQLDGGTSHTFRGQVVLPRRGRYAWGPLEAVSGYPFGLAERRQRLAPETEVIVLPRLGTLHRGRLRRHLRGADLPGDGVRRPPRPHPAAQAEFHGLRGFRTGDSPRSIHWRTSARRGELMVREFEDVPGDDLLVVFDPSLPGAEATATVERFEQAVSLAATLCWEWCQRRGDRLTLATAGPEPLVLDGLTSPAHARRVLECLAVQQLQPAANVPALLARLKATPLPPAAVVLIGTTLAGVLINALRHGLRRSVAPLDAAAPGGLDFYEPPESGVRSQESGVRNQAKQQRHLTSPERQRWGPDP
jgi:uncharacterized protein (DUF58 family)